MSGKFWGTDSEEEDEDFFSESDEEAEDQEASANKWIKDQPGGFDDDDEPQREKARPKHEKLNDTLEKQIENIREKMEANDWNAITKGIIIYISSFLFSFFYL